MFGKVRLLANYWHVSNTEAAVAGDLKTFTGKTDITASNTGSRVDSNDVLGDVVDIACTFMSNDSTGPRHHWPRWDLVSMA